MLWIRSGSIFHSLLQLDVTTKRAVTGEPDQFLLRCNVEAVALSNKWNAIGTVLIMR